MYGRPPSGGGRKADPAALLLRESRGADLIVVGAQFGDRDRRRGSATQAVLRQASCPVVVDTDRASKDHVHRAEGSPMNVEMLERMKFGAGFIAALDQSGGSTPKALRLYGIPSRLTRGTPRCSPSCTDA